MNLLNFLFGQFQFVHFKTKVSLIMNQIYNKQTSTVLLRNIKF